MRQIIRYIIAAVAVLAAASCAKPDSEFLHDDNTISSIWITPADDATRIIYGKIDTPEPGVILFEIPRASRPYFPDPTRLKVRAIVGYDASVSPSLLGAKDLSSDFRITVTANQTGESREYILRVQYLS